MSLTAPSRPTPPRGQPSSGRGGTVVGLLVALTLGAVVAGVFVLVTATGLVSPGTAGAAAARAPYATRGVVVASASCTDPTARDQVEMRAPDGLPRTLPLDACGSGVGSTVDVVVPDGDTVAHLAGTGATGASTDPPGGQRLAVTLGTVAALRTAGLLVAVARRRLAERNVQAAA